MRKVAMMGIRWKKRAKHEESGGEEGLEDPVKYPENEAIALSRKCLRIPETRLTRSLYRRTIIGSSCPNLSLNPPTSRPSRSANLPFRQIYVERGHHFLRQFCGV